MIAGMSPMEVPDWMTASTFHPRLTITARETEQVVATLRREFERAGYAVREATQARIVLRHHDWFAIASGVWARTELTCPPPMDLCSSPWRTAPSTGPVAEGQQALNAAVASLRAQGTDVAIGPWHKASG